MNINIKSNKSHTIQAIRYLPILKPEDEIYADVFSTLATRANKHIKRNELKRKLAYLYDASYFVQARSHKNILAIKYTMQAIADIHLPTNINQEIDSLFEKLTIVDEYSDEQIIRAFNEVELYVKRGFENKQNLCTYISANAMFGEQTLKYEGLINLLENPNLDEYRKFVSRLQQTSIVNFAINDDRFKQNEKHQLEVVAKSINNFEPITVERNLDQAYISERFAINADASRYAKVLANMIFGGGVYSKLFKVIREEKSLSYNISSSNTSVNSLTVSGGINPLNIDEVYETIDLLLVQLTKGNFDEELKLAKIDIINQLKLAKQSVASQLSMMDTNYLEQNFATTDERIEEVKNVTKEEVLAVFKNMKKLGYVTLK